MAKKRRRSGGSAAHAKKAAHAKRVVKPFGGKRRGGSSKHVLAAIAPPSRSTIAAKSFTVYVVNKSSWSIIGVKVGPRGSPIRLPAPVGKTCDGAECDWSCQKLGMALKYAPIHSVACTADPYDLYLLAERDGQFAQSSEPAHIEPKCQESGVWICAEFPD
jgi:hypothetical protein